MFFYKKLETRPGLLPNPAEAWKWYHPCYWQPHTTGLYFLTPLAVVGVMLYDLDPITFLLIQFLKTFQPVESVLMSIVKGYEVLYLFTRFLLIYITNLIGFYELIRLVLLALSGCVFGLEKIIWIGSMGDGFQHTTSNLRLQLRYLKWANLITILFNVWRDKLNQSVLLCLCFVGSSIIAITFVLIRLHGNFESFLVPVFTGCIIVLALITKVSWEILVDIHDQTKRLLSKFQSPEAVTSLPTCWERKIYLRVVRAIRPIGIPLGLGHTTFLVATRSTKLASVSVLVEQMVNVFLIL